MKALLLTLVIAFTGSFASACTKAKGTATDVTKESGAWTKQMAHFSATKNVAQTAASTYSNQNK